MQTTTNTNITTNVYTPSSLPSPEEREQITDFLYTHLDQYGDARADIAKAFEYAMDKQRGGYVISATEDGEIAGAVLLNKTGMDGYIPENILVYIATHQKQRGKGIGKLLMSKAISTVEGDIALHVEPENPAKKLYEKLGFTNKYLEMRLIKNK